MRSSGRSNPTHIAWWSNVRLIVPPQVRAIGGAMRALLISGEFAVCDDSSEAADQDSPQFGCRFDPQRSLGLRPRIVSCEQAIRLRMTVEPSGRFRHAPPELASVCTLPLLIGVRLRMTAFRATARTWSPSATAARRTPVVRFAQIPAVRRRRGEQVRSTLC